MRQLRTRRQRRLLQCGSLVLLLLLGTRVSLVAQATTVSLSGTVLTTDGLVPTASQVEVRSHETGITRTAIVDSITGSFVVLGLPPGSYDLTARAIGFRRQRETVQLTLDQPVRLDFTLERGDTQLEPVIVVGERGRDLDPSGISTAVVREQIERLPLNSRNVLDLAVVAPGVRTYASENSRSIPSAGPVTAPRFINLYVDGVEWKGLAIGSLVGQPQFGSLLPQDGVREFRIYINPYDAEFTRGAGWVISAITQPGGHRLQGSVFGFHQNHALVARGGYHATKPDYRRHQIGGAVRGPLIRDRLFVAASVESQLTDEFLTVVPGRPAADPAIWDEYAGSFLAPLRNHAGVLRLTAPRGSHTLDAIVNVRQLTVERDFGRPLNGVIGSWAAGAAARYDVRSLLLRDTYARDRTVNELSLHVLAEHQRERRLAPGPTHRYPGIQIGRAQLPGDIEEQHIRVVNKLTHMVNGGGGTHVLKGGLQVTNVHGRGWQPWYVDGFFEYPHDTSTLPHRAIIGVGLNDPESTADAEANVRGWIVGAYVQDQWQPHPALTLTAGVRWDAELNTLGQGEAAPWGEDTTLLRIVGERYLNGGDRDHDFDNLAPRLALAWDIAGAGHTQLRAGYGVMYDRVPVFGAFLERVGWAWRTYTFPNPGTTDPEELRQRVAGGSGQARPNLTLLPDRLATPSNRQWSVGVGRRVGPHLSVDVEYLQQRWNDLPVTVRRNVRPLTSRYGDVTLWGSFGDARYRALLGSLSYSGDRSRLDAAYTLGWAKSEFATLTTSDYPDSAAYVMQQSEADERHRIVFSGTTELPFAIQLSAIAIAASPRPYLAFVGSDVNQNGSAADDWPNGERTRRESGSEHWYRTLDLRLAKEVRLPAGRLTVSADVFNVFNNGSHAEYRSSQAFPDFSQPIGEYARRRGQLGLRYSF